MLLCVYNSFYVSIFPHQQTEQKDMDSQSPLALYLRTYTDSWSRMAHGHLPRKQRKII